MTDLHIECCVRARTDPLSVVMPAPSDRPAGIEGSPPGWLVRQLPGYTYAWPRRLCGPTSPGNGSPGSGAVNTTRSLDVSG
jgi:hypothetical protein